MGALRLYCEMHCCASAEREDEDLAGVELDVGVDGDACGFVFRTRTFRNTVLPNRYRSSRMRTGMRNLSRFRFL